MDVGRIVRAGPPGRDGGHRVERGQRAALGVEPQRGHGGIELIGDEHQRPRRVEGEVARARAGMHDGVAAIQMVQGLAAHIEPVDEHPIGAEVRGEREAVGGIGQDAVGMRRFLPLAVRSSARVVYHLRGRRESAVRLNRQQRDVAPGVVGHEHDAAAAIYAQVARRAALGRLLVQSGERAGVSRDREGAHRAARLLSVSLHLVDGVEHAPVGVDGEEGGIPSGGRRADRPQLSGTAVHADDIDPFGPRAVGIRPDVEQVPVHPYLAAGGGNLRVARESDQADRRRGQEGAARRVARVGHVGARTAFPGATRSTACPCATTGTPFTSTC